MYWYIVYTDVIYTYPIDIGSSYFDEFDVDKIHFRRHHVHVLLLIAVLI